MSRILYRPLDRNTREIRLIVLKEKDNTTPDSLLRCELITTSLDYYKDPRENYHPYAFNKFRRALARSFLENGPYSKDFYALSYVWGDSGPVDDIDVDGVVTKTSANLHAALRAIRDNTQFRVIWADALSINQNDNEEKSWQVAQMAAIYSRARATVSWLGPSSEDSEVALKFLTKRRARMDDAVVAANWTATANICSRPYWSRIWIFQEMACARDKYFLCGDFIARDIDISISDLLVWYVSSGKLDGSSLDPQCPSMIASLHPHPNQAGPRSLYELLMRLNALKATEPRDKIYALLGVATDMHELEIVPDYSKRLDLIFKETACALLRNGYPGVLLAASLQDQALQLPSWVPDWSARIDDLYGEYEATKGHSQRSSTLKDIPRLSDHVALDGYIVGTISKICNACPTTALDALGDESDNPTFGDWLSEVETVISPISKPSRGGYNTPESDIIVLLAALGGSPIVWSLLPNPHLQTYKYLRSASSLGSLILDLERNDVTKRDLEQVNCVKRIRKNLERGSRPFQLDSGRAGLTWKDKDRAGDIVVMIPGVCMPCVLRPLVAEGLENVASATRGYQLVGVTYIHRLMGGEFFKKNVPEVQRYILS